MSTIKNLKSGLLRVSALAGLSLSMFVAASPAYAIIATPLAGQAPNAIAGSSDCRLRQSHTVTGTVDDGSNNDQYAIGVINQTNGASSNPFVVSLPVGFTTTDQSTAIIPANFARGDYAIAYYESANGAVPVGATPLSVVSIPRQTMINAGAACAAFVLNGAPNASAGNGRFAAPGDNVTLSSNGSSDPDADPLTFQWTQVLGSNLGPTITLTGASTSQPSFAAPQVSQATEFRFQVEATDSVGASDIAFVVIEVVPVNSAPVVDAGADATVAGDSTVQLSGTASDGDNDPLTYLWEQIGGPSVTFSDATTLNPNFQVPARGREDQVLSFRLTADDGIVTTSDTVDITVAGNEAPTAVATITPSSGLGNSVFTLDGSGTTDPEGDAIVYQWVQTGGPTGIIADPSAAVTTFTAPAATPGVNQTLSFELRATDTFDETGIDTTSTTLLANRSPGADAGVDQDVSGGVVVTLNGTGSTDPEGDPITYSWVLISGNPVTLSDPTIAQPTFTAPAATGQDQLFEFELTVDDGIGTSQNLRAAPVTQIVGTSTTDRVIITVLANRVPVADAGVDQGPINGGDTVTLDGTGSNDPDGDTLTYSWVQTGGPSVTLSDPAAAQPTFTSPNESGTVTFELTVSDGTLTARDTVSIETRAVGSITLIQRVVGPDTAVAFTSGLAALNTSITTVNGVGQVSTQNVATGTYTVTAEDLRAAGYAITAITCDDGDSLTNVQARSATIELAAGEDVTCTFSTANSRAAALESIYTFLTGRNALILANQPDLQRRIDRLSGASSNPRDGSVSAYGVPIPGTEHLPVQGSISRDGARVSTSLASALGEGDGGTFDIWAEAYLSRANIGEQEADFSIYHIGGDIKLSENFLLGAIVQFDNLSDRGTLDAGEAEGDGWMFGPYVTAKLAPGLFAEARAAWGQSENRVSALAGMVDDFDTSRSLYSGSLVGEVDLDTATVFRPELTLRYLSENQKAYTDSLGIAIPSQTVDQGDISLRPRISRMITTDGGWSLRPYAEVEGIYTFGTAPDGALADLLPNSLADVFGDFRGRIEGGVDFFSAGTFRASLSGFYDGIGADNFENTGLHIGLSFGF